MPHPPKLSCHSHQTLPSRLVPQCHQPLPAAPRNTLNGIGSTAHTPPYLYSSKKLGLTVVNQISIHKYGTIFSSVFERVLDGTKRW